MDQRTKKIIIASALVLLALNFLARPFFKRREAIQTTSKVLSLWKSNDLTFVFNFWEDPKKCPPIYDLQSYKILNKSFKKEKGQLKAFITVSLDFPPGNTLPSGKEWTFELTDSDVGWQINSFQINKTESDGY